jgi:ABC-2 type transport system permease protein
MKTFKSFIKMQLNVNYGISALKYRFAREKKKRWEPVLIGVAIIVSMIPLLGMYTALMVSVFMGGMMMGQPEIVLAMAFVLAQLVILIFGIFYIMGAFYFSKDIMSFVPLPLKPYEIIGGKFVVVMVNEYLTSMPVLLPPIIIYGIGTSQGLLYWLKSLALLAAAPVIPLALASLLVVLLMRVVNIGRYKDLLIIVGGIVLVFSSFYFSALMQKMPENPKDVVQFFAGQTRLSELIGSRFPPAVWATEGLAGSGLSGAAHFMLFLAVSAGLFIFMLWVANQVFYKALLAGQEVSRKRKTLTGTQIDRRLGRGAGPVVALLKREWKLLMRTPLYMLNGLMGNIAGPIMLVMIYAVRGSADELASLADRLNDPGILPYAVLICVGIMLFTAGMNVVASTAVSREGKTMWVAKMIPVTARQQVDAKFLCGYIVSAIGVVATTLIMVFLLKLPILWTAGATVVGLIGSVPMAALSLLVDVFHPKLVWNSEQEAMKQNMNALLGMLISLLIMLIMAAAAAGTLLLGFPVTAALAAVAILSAIIGALSLMALHATAEKKYREIEA